MQNTQKPPSNAVEIELPELILVGYGEATELAKQFGVTKQNASYHLKQGNPEYLAALAELRMEKRRALRASQIETITTK
jgi:hypothetical protein